MQVQCTFYNERFTVTLENNPTANDLLSLLPLDLTIEDYSTNEKIARLPRTLTEGGSGRFSREAPGDLAYYAPWGNLAFFHSNYRYSKGLIRIGRLDDTVRPLLTRGTYPLRIANPDTYSPKGRTHGYQTSRHAGVVPRISRLVHRHRQRRDAE